MSPESFIEQTRASYRVWCFAEKLKSLDKRERLLPPGKLRVPELELDQM